jgi:DNA replication and repair protein RecF
MLLQHLSLTNFRNFIRLEIDLPPGPTVFVGANAQGKTSLLEAIYYLASASSPHTSSDRQVINFLALQEPSPFARLVGEYRRQGRLQRVEVRLILEPPATSGEEPRLQKEISLNGVRRRARDLAAGFHAVLFLPQDLRSVEGPPSARRQLLDEALSQAEPGYAGTLSDYSRALSQRNALLKQLQERNGDPGQLEFWDEQIADLGASVIRARALAIQEWDALAGPIHTSLTRGREALRLEYLPGSSYLPAAEGQLELSLAAPVNPLALRREALREELSAALARSRPEEIARGLTLLGPQRDEVRLLANGVDLRAYGSRGQCRTALLSLKLALVEWLQSRDGEPPALLLDEVLAELDEERRASLLQRVSALEQAILTASDGHMFPEWFRERATWMRVQQGRIGPA